MSLNELGIANLELLSFLSKELSPELAKDLSDLILEKSDD